MGWFLATILAPFYAPILIVVFGAVGESQSGLLRYQACAKSNESARRHYFLQLDETPIFQGIDKSAFAEEGASLLHNTVSEWTTRWGIAPAKYRPRARFPLATGEPWSE
jgi:hypothetical protein